MTIAPARDSWVTYPRPNPAACMRLFCFPYAGGSAGVFRALASTVGPQIELCPIQLPGRESRLRELPFTSLSALVQELAHALVPHMDLPFAFFGHSMGTLIGFELARRLRKEYGRSPVHLFVSGHRAPQLSRRSLPIYHLPEPSFIEQLRRFDGTPEAVLQNAEVMQLMLPLLRADFAVCETYHYTPDDPLDSPISAFGGTQDHEVSQADLAAWRCQTSNSFHLHMFPGNHFFLKSALARLIQTIVQDLQWVSRQTLVGWVTDNGGL